MPIVFIIIPVVAVKLGIDIFDVKGIELIYVFAAMTILFLLFFYALRLLMKKYNTPVIISTILVLSLMPVMVSLLISFSLTKTSLYAILNIALMNLPLTLVGTLIALVVWHKFRTMEFMLKWGY